MGKRKVDSELYRIKLDKGTVYQTSKGGNYYFRYQVNKERKCVSLKTANHLLLRISTKSPCGNGVASPQNTRFAVPVDFAEATI